MKPNKASSVNKAIKKIFLRRAKRLIRLIELNAPDIIICNEINLMHKKLPVFGKSYLNFLENVVAGDIGKEKNLLGICCEIECNNAIHLENGDELQKCPACEEKFRKKFEHVLEEFRKCEASDFGPTEKATGN